MREVEQLRKLTDYIKKNLKKGYTLDSLRWALISQGNSKMEVDKAIALAQKEITKQAPVQSSVEPAPQIDITPENTQPENKSFWKSLFS